MKRHRPGLGPLHGYLLGLGLVVVGAAVMEWLDSWVPLALAGSASLMLTFRLVRQIAARGRAGDERKR